MGKAPTEASIARQAYTAKELGRLAVAVSNKLRELGATPEGARLRTACRVFPPRHVDKGESLVWDEATGTYECDVCHATGGAVHFSRLLDVPLPSARERGLAIAEKRRASK